MFGNLRSLTGAFLFEKRLMFDSSCVNGSIFRIVSCHARGKLLPSALLHDNASVLLLEGASRRGAAVRRVADRMPELSWRTVRWVVSADLTGRGGIARTLTLCRLRPLTGLSQLTLRTLPSSSSTSGSRAAAAAAQQCLGFATVAFKAL
jgi:hypothetical protein